MARIFGEFGYLLHDNIVRIGMFWVWYQLSFRLKEDKEGSAIYKVCLISSITFAIVLLVLALILSPVFRVIHVSANYYLICILMGVFLVVNNWAAMTYTWGNRQKAYKLLMYNPIIGQVVKILSWWSVLLLLDVKSVGLIAGAIVSQIVIMIHLLRHLKPMQFKHSIEDFKVCFA